MLTAGPATAAVPVQCDFTVSPVTGWGPDEFWIDLVLTNRTGVPLAGWTVDMTFDEETALGFYPSRVRMSQPAPTRMVARNWPGAPSLPPNGTIVFGWTASAAAGRPPALTTVNGVSC